MQEIKIPHDMYTIKMFENIDLFIVSPYFRCNRMKKIESNIDIISKMFLKKRRIFDMHQSGSECLSNYLLLQ